MECQCVQKKTHPDLPAGIVCQYHTNLIREEVAEAVADAIEAERERAAATPIPMRITCPDCGALHIDEGEFATRVHHTHACQHCGAVFRNAVVPTVGVRFLPGFQNG